MNIKIISVFTVYNIFLTLVNLKGYETSSFNGLRRNLQGILTLEKSTLNAKIIVEIGTGYLNETTSSKIEKSLVDLERNVKFIMDMVGLDFESNKDSTNELNSIHSTITKLYSNFIIGIENDIAGITITCAKFTAFFYSLNRFKVKIASLFDFQTYNIQMIIDSNELKSLASSVSSNEVFTKIVFFQNSFKVYINDLSSPSPIVTYELIHKANETNVKISKAILLKGGKFSPNHKCYNFNLNKLAWTEIQMYYGNEYITCTPYDDEYISRSNFLIVGEKITQQNKASLVSNQSDLAIFVFLLCLGVVLSVYYFCKTHNSQNDNEITTKKKVGLGQNIAQKPNNESHNNHDKGVTTDNPIPKDEPTIDPRNNKNFFNYEEQNGKNPNNPPMNFYNETDAELLREEITINRKKVINENNVNDKEKTRERKIPKIGDKHNNDHPERKNEEIIYRSEIIEDPNENDESKI